MKQKTIWMIVLFFGILSSFYSCNESVDKSFHEEFIYTNNSDYNIIIKTFNKTENGFVNNSYHIDSKHDFSQEHELTFGDNTGMIALCDSVLIQFGDSVNIHFFPDTESSFNVLTHENYTCVNKDENHRSCEYRFTNEDYENALQ